ncbi:ExeM/NucH family extracellular endonuclease [Kineococcus aurantiacus]|uniref:5'-nucleotidase n=1 Tax=Kineococcus aurantiacus TaxID=37633 RepID=A0A7Y9AU53_9ACTN|nr:ExeM/NucH family extracellular endonuclease [Kineococcus aurantiacus]NYD21473.1 5'-nucleotidase [Kineococcus aurantiacus]
MFLVPGRLGACTRRAAVGAAAVSLTALGLPVVAALPASAATLATPFVSELHYDNDGTDSGEFVEVQLPAGTSSAGLSVVLYNGGNGAVYDTDALPAVTAPAGAPAVAVVQYPANGVQNGSPDGVALVGADGAVLEFLSYEGPLTAVGGPAAGLTSTDVGVAESATTPVGQSLQRTVDASGALVWSGPATASPGALNTAAAGDGQEPSGSCDSAPTHEVGQVQGSGATTPLAGQRVTVRGTVVGATPGLSGFYLQDPDGDGDATTSDGVFVHSDVAVGLGDTVSVTGTAQEYYDQTQVDAGAAVAVCADGTAADLPAPAVLDLPAGDAAREVLEGVLVVPADELTVSEVYALTSYGELTLSQGGLLVQPTELARPGSPEAVALAAADAERRVLLDDAVSARTSATARPYLSPDSPVRVGDVAQLREPVVLGYGFDEWRLVPAEGTADGLLAPQDTRPEAPAAVGGDLQVGAFNVLNYFLTFGGAGRGAANQAELDEQAGKIVPAVRGLGADVVTLLEIEDTDSTGLTPGNADTALADLVRRLNAAEGSDVWAYVPLPAELYAVDRDVIRNGIVYRTDAVEPVGAPVGLVDETVWSNAREPIAQTFRATAEGDVLTVVANHFKSKSPGAPTGDNVDAGDGQGQWNGDRTRQAASLAAFVERLRQSSGDPDVVALGDFNAYSQEDPVVALHDAGLTDLGAQFDPGRYSYVFDGLSGSLDHAFGTAELTAKVTGVTHWNINAVESFAYQYAGDPALYAADPYRSSDHDPLVLGLELQPPAPPTCQGLTPTLVGTPGDDVLRGTSGRDVVVGLGGDDVITGGNGDDVLCGGDGDDRVSGGSGDDVLLGGAGDDVLNGDNGSDRLLGGAGDDVLVQGRGTGVEDPGGPAA